VAVARHSCLALTLSAALLAPGARAAHRPDPDRLPAVRVQDLHYGEVLFQYYSGHEFQALTELEAFGQWQRMPHHLHDADLLAGALYLELGMYNEAGARFQRLLTAEVPVGVRNRAWFYLAKIWYQRGYYPRAEQAMEHIQGSLGPELDAERTHLLVNALMRQQRFDAAIALLANWHGPPDWMAYAGFNLGVALVRAGRLADADPVLTRVGTLQSSSEELLSLRDKANLALGFAYLQAREGARARVPLERVRLNGPYSSRALLADGWARSDQGDFRGALAPWLELSHRDLLDAAVQESYLAIPYAYGKLDADAEAAGHYERALTAFRDESVRLDAAIERVRSGHLVEDLLGEEPPGQYEWLWQLKRLPDTPQSRYLYTVLADNDFQSGLKNFRDIAFLGGRLGRWDQSMQAFAAMLDTRRRAYAERLPAVEALLGSDRLAQMRGERESLGGQLEAAVTGHDVAALGTHTERKQWWQAGRLGRQLGDLPAGDERDQARDKLRLIRGALYWQLDAAFKERDYREHRALRELDGALEELQNRWVRVQQARATVPQQTEAFAARVAALAARIQSLRTRLDASAHQQSRALEDVAVGQLTARRQRLDAYALQARFALAAMYDRAVDRATPAEQPGASTPPQTPAGDTEPRQ
jgi:hypothetical protein